ncbi:Lnb N-terminal periplasmic domain-containing protein [Pseudotabrizicola algicola]|uniref:DUF4105 domain-containing protein n=1 Tax=Pseudotabrizicola algicola TaxID=2709381 RepID=A0A6B3RI45_9RHOB|nr:DUF4105 domain-containing protein [Pseudotabrizicola algicola]NEX45081.1 DUF4105 domain-containing protein [Pseudotabrizicola algicola]
MRRGLQVLGRGAQLLAAAFVLVWVWLAVQFHAGGALGLALHAVIGLLGLSAVWAALKRRWGLIWAGMGAVLAGFVLWWVMQIPRDDRTWAADVRHGVTGEIDGSRVTLRNVRNFRWQDADTAEENWEVRVVDAARITSLDMFTSVWDSPLIAHVLVSFGFDDGQRIVFSGEIRREKGEVYSALGGFFRRYELVMIAADERDIVHLRTDARGERVSLFPVSLEPEVRKQLFMNFVNRANELAAEPEWYHTIWANCTTVPFRLVKTIAPSVALDWRVLASGYLPAYLHELGVLPPDMPLPDILQRSVLPKSGPEAVSGPAYSESLRQNWVSAP